MGAATQIVRTSLSPVAIRDLLAEAFLLINLLALNLVPILAKTLELEGCLVVAKPGHQGKVVLVL
jgi:hypothetical protein